MTLTDTLRRLAACSEALEWAATQPDPETAWGACPRGDWLLWLLDALTVDLGAREWRLLACDFAADVVPFVTDEWVASICEGTIEVARRHALGDASDEELAAASAATWDATWDAAWAGAGDAARAATSAATWDAAWARQANVIRAAVPWERVRPAWERAVGGGQ